MIETKAGEVMKLKVVYDRILHHIDKLKSNRTYVMITGIILLFSVSLLGVVISGNEYSLALSCSLFLFFSILSFLLLKKRKVLFEPIYLFSGYYITVCLSIWYLVGTHFATNEFINNTQFNSDFVSLFTISCFYYFIGYIFTVLGYRYVKQDKVEIKFELEDKKKISDRVINIVIFVFFLIGLFNFLYNVYLFADGNLLLYLKNISNRSREFAMGGTTIGYIFAETSIYVWFFKMLRNKKYSSITFVICLSISTLMKISVGRIFQTFVFIGVLIGVYYFIEIWERGFIRNRKYIMIACGILCAGVFFYFLRLASNLSSIGYMEGGIFSTFQSFIGKLGYYAVDRGNMPNVALMPKIIDAWPNDIGFLYGSSFLIFLFSFLPGQFIPITLAPSVLIKNTWYQHITGGNLPPTGIGEMYANFGPFGIIFGMFLFGVLIAYLYKFMIKSKNYWVLVIGMQISIGFIALYPKGEFSNLSLWMIMPIALTYCLLRTLTTLEYKWCYRKVPKESIDYEKS